MSELNLGSGNEPKTETKTHNSVLPTRNSQPDTNNSEPSIRNYLPLSRGVNLFSEQRLPQHNAINLFAHFLFTSLFLLFGITHFTNVPDYLGLMPEPVPYKRFLIYLSGIMELAGALMFLCNWHPRLGGWLLIMFLLPVTVVVHGYEMLNATDETICALQQAHFLKGFALTGAALLVTQVGVSQPIKLDD